MLIDWWLQMKLALLLLSCLVGLSCQQSYGLWPSPMGHRAAIYRNIYADQYLLPSVVQSFETQVRWFVDWMGISWMVLCLMWFDWGRIRRWLLWTTDWAPSRRLRVVYRPSSILSSGCFSSGTCCLTRRRRLQRWRLPSLRLSFNPVSKRIILALMARMSLRVAFVGNARFSIMKPYSQRKFRGKNHKQTQLLSIIFQKFATI